MKKIKLFSQGFTLVELLVVIVLIGALAIGLFATIDPIEQVNRGTDSAVRNVAREFNGAVQRYYTQKSQYPWVTTAASDNPSGGALSGLGTVITELKTASELKSNFDTAAGTATLSRIFVSLDANNEPVSCFLPKSKSMKTDPSAIYTIAGAAVASYATACPLGGGATDCYLCYR
jgi:prepilin-type N-terminal cleavage/methylation domain-containing protein